MKRALLFLLALGGLPLIGAFGWAFVEGLARGTFDAPLYTPGRAAFAGGCAAMFGLYLWKGRALQVVYIFAHEMTHALAGLLCLARVHRVSVRQTGGFVSLDKQNCFIALAPYCLPLYLLVAVSLAGACTLLWPEAVPNECWYALFGLCAAFHVLYTFDALCTVSQPDVHLYGRFFSYWLILLVNLFFASAALVLSGEVPARTQGALLLTHSAHSYRLVGRGAYALLRPLFAESNPRGPHESRR